MRVAPLDRIRPKLWQNHVYKNTWLFSMVHYDDFCCCSRHFSQHIYNVLYTVLVDYISSRFPSNSKNSRVNRCRRWRMQEKEKEKNVKIVSWTRKSRCSKFIRNFFLRVFDLMSTLHRILLVPALPGYIFWILKTNSLNLIDV